MPNAAKVCVGWRWLTFAAKEKEKEKKKEKENEKEKKNEKEKERENTKEKEKNIFSRGSPLFYFEFLIFHRKRKYSRYF